MRILSHQEGHLEGDSSSQCGDTVSHFIAATNSSQFSDAERHGREVGCKVRVLL